MTGGIKIEKTGCFDLEKAELVSNDSVHGNCFGQLRPVCLCIRGGSRGVLTRLDDKGYLYYMDYQKDYYSPKVMNIMRKIGYIDPGCSVFFTHNVKENLLPAGIMIIHTVFQKMTSP